MHEFFSLKRSAKILRKDILSEYKSLITLLGTTAGVLLVISALNMLFAKLSGGYGGDNGQVHYTIFILLLFPGGFILTSTMFKDVHDKSKNIYWLMLPGSTFEKMLSRLLLSSVFYAVLLTLIYPVLAAVSESFNLLVFGIRHEFFNPFRSEVLKLIPYYLVTQSIFFAGSVFFRKHPFAKTLLALALFNIALSILAAIALRIIIGPNFRDVQNLNINFGGSNFMRYAGQSIDTLNKFSHFMSVSARIFFWGLLAPYFYVMSYFKLSEKEVRDGV